MGDPLRVVPLTASVAVVGGDGPPAVLLHDDLFDSRQWWPQLESLQSTRTVVAVDERGHGSSAAPTGAYDPADDVLEAIRSLGLRRPLLIGFGSGASHAACVAVRLGGEVEALVFVEPSGAIVGQAINPDELLETAATGVLEIVESPEFAPLVEAVERSSTAEVVDWLMQPGALLSADHPDCAMVRQMVEDNIRIEPIDLVVQPPATLLADLRELCLPTLIVLRRGTPDLPFHTQSLGTNPLSRVVRTGTSAQLVNLESPAEFNAELAAFLDAVHRGS